MNKTNTPIQVKGIDHVTMIVSDLERSKEFYCDLLGMRQIERPAFPFPGLWFQAGNSQIHLILGQQKSASSSLDPGSEKVTPGIAHHFAFEVDDAYSAAEQLKAHDIRIMGGPTFRPDGCIQVWFYDPDGHVVEVFQWPTETPH